MAIRIRNVKGKVVALCAALSKEKKGDIYLGDAEHHALSTKLEIDFWSEGIIKELGTVDECLIRIMQKEQGGKLY
jgi:hypothetical protein